MNYYEDYSSADLVEELDRIRLEEIELKDRKARAQSLLIAHLTANNESTILATGSGVKGTLVRPERVIYDEAKLKASLPPEIFDTLFVRSFSKELLERAVADGRVPVDTVVACAETKPVTPHLRLSKVDLDDYDMSRQC